MNSKTEKQLAVATLEAVEAALDAARAAISAGVDAERALDTQRRKLNDAFQKLNLMKAMLSGADLRHVVGVPIEFARAVEADRAARTSKKTRGRG